MINVPSHHALILLRHGGCVGHDISVRESRQLFSCLEEEVWKACLDSANGERRAGDITK